MNQKQSIVKTHPNLVKEWHKTKNGKLKPEDFTAGSHQKIWWQCNKVDDHEWNAIIKERVRGSGCSVCAGKKVIKSNSLAFLYPEIVKQWHPTKNEKLKPENVLGGSHKKVWWKCEKANDHEWNAVISSRIQGRGCPFCTNKRLVLSNSLKIMFPKLAKEWHPTKNGELKPENVVGGSTKKIWWKCDKGDDHEWEASILHRIKGDSCIICSNRKLVKSNSLAFLYPELAKEWHPSKNGKLKSENIIGGSHKKIWWKCDKGDDHEWEASILHRIKGDSCIICSNRKLVKSNSLAFKYPELAKEWHPTKNEKLKPENVISGGTKKVWWKCTKENDHEWQSTISSRINGNNCPFCANQKLVKSNSLAFKYPELAKEWHPTKNEKLKPENVMGGGEKKVWWKCPKGDDHEYESQIYSRTKGQGCPICSNKKLVASNSLQRLYPELAKEFDIIKNKITPDNVIAGGHKKYWWICSKSKDHTWEAPIIGRVNNHNCPQCNSGWTIENIRLFIKSILDHIDSLTPTELYVLFQQSGLLKSDGKAKPFIKLLKTGKFPKEELVKFCENQPSLVDDVIYQQLGSLEELSNDSILKHEISEKELEEEIKDKELPIIETKDALAVLDNKVFSTADQEAVDFLIISGCAKLWNHTFLNEVEAVKQAMNFNGGEYPTRVKNLFLDEYNGAKSLKIPNGYSFKINGRLIQPNLMQRLIAYRMKKYKRQGNWSGTGAGKTLSAILASKVINAKITLICCPNSVVENWRKNLINIYPDSNVNVKTFEPNIISNKNNYLIFNYEMFQNQNSKRYVKQLIDNYKIDFIIIDEIHYSKQRVTENISQRKKVILGLISNVYMNNNDLHILGMSATPVINTLFEGISLLEMISGVKYNDLIDIPSINNCIALYQNLAKIGIRWLPNYEQKLHVNKIDVDCSEYLYEIKKLNIKNTMLDLEKILTKARLKEIRRLIKPKTLIYTHYVDEICNILKKELELDGWNVAFYTGEDKTGLQNFLEGDTDVLIGSSSIGTGVDGLQLVCNRLIINILPWTHAEFQQLLGRIYRQGQVKSEVEVFIPITYANNKGERWSWDESKWKRIQHKKSIADACVDGIIPEGQLRSPAQAYADTMNWLSRINEGKINQITRERIHIPLSETIIQKQIRKYGDFSEMNRRMNNSLSNTTNGRFRKDPAEWEQYHALYREARKEWNLVPYEEMIKWCKARPYFVIGDFGCGEARIAEALQNTVYSFDHIAINESVIACDMSHVPLENEILDVAIFSLSLMGTNFTDYIKEAHRCLKLDGNLFIIEATSRFINIQDFSKSLALLGFDIVTVEQKYKFTFIRAMKNDKEQKEIELKL